MQFHHYKYLQWLLPTLARTIERLKRLLILEELHFSTFSLLHSLPSPLATAARASFDLDIQCCKCIKLYWSGLDPCRKHCLFSDFGPACGCQLSKVALMSTVCNVLHPLHLLLRLSEPPVYLAAVGTFYPLPEQVHNSHQCSGDVCA